MTKIIYIFGLGLVVLLTAGAIFVDSVKAPVVTDQTEEKTEDEEAVFCTMDAMQCPDGTYVGRTGPSCEFVCPAAPQVPEDVAAEIEAMADQIVLNSPLPLSTVSSPLTINGQARGPWFFEASFPVVLVNWDGLIIAEGIATANTDWMTEDFVPFTANLNFTSPYHKGDEDFMKRGALILKKDNPSGLPENDAALQIPLLFAPI